MFFLGLMRNDFFFFLENIQRLFIVNHTDLLGKRVLSSYFGIGKIVGIDQLGGSDKDFFVIESNDKKIKHFISCEDEHTYRLLSDKKNFELVLAQLASQAPQELFESKKDRINFFKAKSKIQDINTMAETLIEFKKIDDLGAIEKQIYQKIIDSLALEHSIINDGSTSESKSIIIEKLTGEKNEQ